AGTGRFAFSHRLDRPGTLTVRVEVAGVQGAAHALKVLPGRVGRGSGRTSVDLLQQRLRAMGYVVGRRGRYDARTARAVLAFRKVTGMARTSRASGAVMRRIARGGGSFRVRRPGLGRHIEADLSRQVIALIDRGRVQRIYPTSTGAPSTRTIRGSFRVYRKDAGTNALGMVHSSYFIRGYAIHGFSSVPIYPASHGCLRVPIPDALSLFRWVRRGTPVVVYA
ncbi:MAG: L,D-transpeptidase family protein, partial [Solirubrobacterales bacterium]|nr:L,D-transpeptidase family protein [Solirubrobacterales bacterium]